MQPVRRFRFFTAVPFIATVAFALGSPGARVSASSPPSSPDLSTPQGINAYLLSQGVDPATAIRQVGLLNYVGSACPGAGWNCVAPTHTPVVQEAPLNGINVYSCSATVSVTTAPGSARCFALQVNAGVPSPALAPRATSSTAASDPKGDNQYHCQEQINGGDADTLNGCSTTQSNTTGNNQADIQEQSNQQSSAAPSASEATTLDQMNTAGNNQAHIQQQSQQQSGDTQTVSQTDTLTQTNGTGNNQADVQQQIEQQVNDAAASQDQEVTQAACVQQDSPSGQNQASVKQQVQQQERDSSASGTTQDQDMNFGPDTTCGSSTTTIEPNLGALVLQDENTPAATGQNQENVNQQLQEQMQSTPRSGSVFQQQGSSSFETGGLEAIPNQNSTGVSQAHTDQDEKQVVDAETTPATLTQQQFDPIHNPSGEGVQGTNTNDTFKLSQNGVQDADAGGFQSWDLQGDCTSSGSCNVTQTQTSNSGTQQTSCTTSPCSNGISNEGG